MEMPLGELHNDINLAINCVTGRPDAADAQKKRIEGGFEGNDIGQRPVIYEQSAEYRRARHQELKEMILKDEEEFGMYNASAIKEKRIRG